MKIQGSKCWNGVKRPHSKSGFTLVEVLVAALLILFMIMGTTATMRLGQKAAALDAQRNTVRQAMIGEMEKAKYGHTLFDALPLESNSSTISLNDNGLTAIMTIEVDSNQYALLTPISPSSVDIPRKQITLHAAWTSLDGNDTLTMEGWICNLIP
jgi:type II secretory pathway pseudopilin PulG